MQKSIVACVIGIMVSSTAVADGRWGYNDYGYGHHHHHHHGYHGNFGPSFYVAPAPQYIREEVHYYPQPVQVVPSPPPVTYYQQPVIYQQPVSVYHQPSYPQYQPDRRTSAGLVGGAVGSMLGYEAGRGDPLAAGIGAVAGSFIGNT